MADRTSAEIFGAFFDKLAEHATMDDKRLARWLWELRGKYDFRPYQMYVDDALVDLELARQRHDVVYFGDEDFDIPG